MEHGILDDVEMEKQIKIKKKFIITFVFVIIHCEMKQKTITKTTRKTMGSSF